MINYYNFGFIKTYYFSEQVLGFLVQCEFERTENPDILIRRKCMIWKKLISRNFSTEELHTGKMKEWKDLL